MAGEERLRLYSEIEPYRKGRLPVSVIHELYYEESGQARGEPALFIHGGPGSGTSATQRRYFDPNHYRIVLFDQRGAGLSTPHACIEQNTTWDLVEDIEKLRRHLGIEHWLLFGGSWGSALALAYAEAFPERVKGLILRGVFLLRPSEISWFYQDGASWLFPDAWEGYIAAIPKNERDDLLRAYYRRLTADDPAVRVAAAVAWTRWEKSTSFLLPRPDFIDQATDEKYSLAFARVECHYFTNHGFFESETQLLDQITRIRHLPAVIVQGRYDVVCPMATAWALHRAWPEAEFHIVPVAGHSAYENGIQELLVDATNRFRDL
jgi:proline iminopeptidase